MVCAFVIAWSMPVDREVEPPLLASWIGSDTIVVAQPDAWQDGTPNEAVLHRLTISLSGETTVDELVRFETRRDERGLVISEFALSPDRDDLAYRLRHFDTTSSSGTRYDTLHVASTADLGRAIEVERGGVGDGLTWSGDSEWLVAGTRGRIARYSADGRHLEYLSPRGLAAAHPLLVGDAIWFAVTDTDGEDIWQVEDD